MDTLHLFATSKFFKAHVTTWSPLILAIDPRDRDAEELSKNPLSKVTEPLISTAGPQTQFSPLYFLSSFHSTIPVYYDGDTVIFFFHFW